MVLPRLSSRDGSPRHTHWERSHQQGSTIQRRNHCMPSRRCPTDTSQKHRTCKRSGRYWLHTTPVSTWSQQSHALHTGCPLGTECKLFYRSLIGTCHLHTRCRDCGRYWRCTCQARTAYELLRQSRMQSQPGTACTQPATSRRSCCGSFQRRTAMAHSRPRRSEILPGTSDTPSHPPPVGTCQLRTACT